MCMMCDRGCAAADLELLLTAPPLQSLALSPQIMFSGLRRACGVAGGGGKFKKMRTNFRKKEQYQPQIVNFPK